MENFLGAVRRRYSQLPVQFSLKSENFYYDFKMIFLALILAMMSEQKRSSHVQTALDSKPFELKIPDTTQMKDLLKSFLTITDFNKFFLNLGR